MGCVQEKNMLGTALLVVNFDLIDRIELVIGIVYSLGFVKDEVRFT